MYKVLKHTKQYCTLFIDAYICSKDTATCKNHSDEHQSEIVFISRMGLACVWRCTGNFTLLMFQAHGGGEA